MKILMAASEMAPFLKGTTTERETETSASTATVLSALSAAIQKDDHELCIALPFYRSLLKEKKINPESTEIHFTVPVGNQHLTCEIFETRTPEGLQIFFIGRDEYFDRPELYGEKGESYQDNCARFSFYARAVVELARRLSPLLDIIHCHDWQTALIPAIVREAHLPFKTVLSIHKLEQQGNFWSHHFALTNLPNNYFSPAGFEFYGSLNFLKGGILFSDAIVLPSQRYVTEAQQPKHGCGIDVILRECSKKLYGINNGIDAAWNPENDPLIKKSYTATSQQKGKAECSSHLLSLLSLKPSPKGPIIALMSQFVEEKGFDLLLPILDRLLAADVRFILLGKSPSKYETALKTAARKHISKFSYQRDYNQQLTHQVLAGTHILLLPTNIQLSGMSVMQALKYGTIPITQACNHHLNHFIPDDPTHQTKIGFVFYDHTSEALLDSLRHALAVFEQKHLWQDRVARALSTDVSWDTTARSYEKLYAALLDSLKSPPLL